jgi:hypothetical protein
LFGKTIVRNISEGFKIFKINASVYLLLLAIFKSQIKSIIPGISNSKIATLNGKTKILKVPLKEGFN